MLDVILKVVCPVSRVLPYVVRFYALLQGCNMSFLKIYFRVTVDLIGLIRNHYKHGGYSKSFAHALDLSFQKNLFDIYNLYIKICLEYLAMMDGRGYNAYQYIVCFR